MTFTRAIYIILVVLGLHAIGLFFGLYGRFGWYDIPLHFGGGFAMGALGLAIWNQGIQEVKFKGWLAKHLRWWLVPLFVLGFVAVIGIGWEWHEYLLDELFTSTIDGMQGFKRQPGIGDTMADFFFDLLGGALALLLFRPAYEKR